jgi:hypothetical protein
VATDVTRRLLSSGVVQRDEVERAVFAHVTSGTPVLRALIEAGALSPPVLEAELSNVEAPLLKTVVPLLKLYDALPPGMCRALLALPIRRDAMTGVVDVAAVDPLDGHVAGELGYHLRSPVRMVRASLAVIEEAILRVEQGAPPDRQSQAPPPPRLSRKTPPYLSRDGSTRDAVSLAATMPQIRQHNSDMPIPLVRRASMRPPAIDKVPESMDYGSLPPPRPMTHPPSTRPGPFNPRAPRGPLPDLGPVMDAIRAARTRDEIMDLLLNGLAMTAGRVGAFVVRKGHFRGFRCNETMADVRSFRALEIPVDVPSVLATASTTGIYLGPIPRTEAHLALLGAMGGVFTEVAVVPVRVDGLLAMMLMLDELGDTMVATRRAEQLGKAAGEALARVLQREKQLGIGQHGVGDAGPRGRQRASPLCSGRDRQLPTGARGRRSGRLGERGTGGDDRRTGRHHALERVGGLADQHDRILHRDEPHRAAQHDRHRPGRPRERQRRRQGRARRHQRLHARIGEKARERAPAGQRRAVVVDHERRRPGPVLRL